MGDTEKAPIDTQSDMLDLLDTYLGLTVGSGAIRVSRPTLDQYFMMMAFTASWRATCRHRWQGAIIVRDKQIIATGYNGAPSKVMDCLSRQFCSKAEGLPCMAEGLHGESNAIISAARLGISVVDTTMYCIYSPCRSCCNMIKTAGISTVVYKEVYSNYPDGPKYLTSLGVNVFQLSDEEYERVPIRIT